MIEKKKKEKKKDIYLAFFSLKSCFNPIKPGLFRAPRSWGGGGGGTLCPPHDNF